MTGYDRHHPWVCWLGGLHAGRCSTRQAAMNLVDRPWRRGNALVKHEGNGETWERRRGSWFKTTPGTPRRAKAAAAPVTRPDETATRPDRAAVSGGADDGPDPSSAPFVPRQQLVLL